MKLYTEETHSLLKLLKANYYRMSPQQFRTLKGQCLSGDVEGAKKGFYRIVRKGVN